MSRSFDPITEIERDQLHNHGPLAWMMRPCGQYLSEYFDCVGIRPRFHQYFIFGELLDCSQWRKDYAECMNFRATKNPESLNSVVESEKRRIDDRLNSSSANDVWTYREQPPADWDRPLPEWFTKHLTGMPLDEHQKKHEARYGKFSNARSPLYHQTGSSSTPS